MKSNDYHGIDSLARLRSERAKLSRRISASEQSLYDDYRKLCSMLSVGNIIKGVIQRVDNIRTVIAGIREGYRSISAMFRKQDQNS